jgi:hypothetical protein
MIKQTHRITLNIIFNGPINKTNALREFKDSIYGLHYTSFGYLKGAPAKYPETFRIGAAK